MEEISAEIVVIGSGPAGQKAAIQAAKLGKRTVIIEKFTTPGGNCLYSGTIPSKTLREAIVDLTRYNERGFYPKEYKPSDVNLDMLNSRLKRVIDEEKEIIIRQCKKNNIRILVGIAKFETPYLMTVTDEENCVLYQVKGERFILATGSSPRNPSDVPFDGEVILDSTSLLQIKRLPKSSIILGGGVIGSEYASFLAALGGEVTVIDKREHLLPMIDTEIGVHLQKGLTDLGLKFVGNKEPAKIERKGDKAVVTCKDGAVYEADALLYALGRTANISQLGLENTSIEHNAKGYIPVNDLFQTVVPHIYAVGDLIGGPCLASTSMEQGRLASRHACGVDTHRFPSNYPVGIYTIPEVSSVGYTEEDLLSLGFNYGIGRAYYYEIARSHIVGSNIGMFKILFHAETLEILGVHIVGRSATEVIHIGQVAMSFNAKMNYFIDQVFNYPTFAEGYRIAALNGVNKLKKKLTL